MVAGWIYTQLYTPSPHQNMIPALLQHIFEVDCSGLEPNIRNKSSSISEVSNALCNGI